ncbi:unnamed protein product, partial [Rotaria magnacalcarata]
SNSIESNKVLHICSQCTRTFKDINNFREHLFQEHGELGVNVRQCHLCSYATLLKSKYDCHIRCHLNNRVIRCQKCNYSTINIRFELFLYYAKTPKTKEKKSKNNFSLYLQILFLSINLNDIK